MVSDNIVDGTQAWSAFAAPKATKLLKLKDGRKQNFQFSKAEREAYQGIREAVQIKLYKKYGKACAYCRRPVGHYGYDWHIEHVLPKARYGSHTFKLANLAVGCVHCNSWKCARVDRNVKGGVLPIINPVEPGFSYARHMKYVYIGTEDFNFAKYSPVSHLGQETYTLLELSELERAQAVNSLDDVASALHERITRAMSAGIKDPEGQRFIALMTELSSAIYRRPD